MAFVVACILGAGLALLGCDTRRCVAQDKVKTVGGCDRMGYCGAVTKRGLKIEAKYPVVGETVCTERK